MTSDSPTNAGKHVTSNIAYELFSCYTVLKQRHIILLLLNIAIPLLQTDWENRFGIESIIV